MFFLFRKHNSAICVDWFVKQSRHLIKVAKTPILLKLTLLLIYPILSPITFPTVTFANTNSQLVSNLIISEINPFGSIGVNSCKVNNSNTNRCSFDKWIEIYNPGPNSVNLNGWSLQFLESDQKINNLVFTSNILLPADSYFLISYKESQYQSVLNLANIKLGGITGKIRNLSNRETGRIQVSLLNPQAQKVFTVNLRLQDFPDLEESLKLNRRHSLEYTGQQWVVATNEFYPNNFGTPKNTVSLLNLDLDNQQVESLVTNTGIVNDSVPNHSTAENSATENANANVTETVLQPAVKPDLQTQTNLVTEPLPNNSLITENNLLPISDEMLTNPNPEPATHVSGIAATEQQTSTINSTNQSAQNLVKTPAFNQHLTYSDLSSLLIKQINILDTKTVIFQDKTVSESTRSTHSYSQLVFVDQTSLWEYFFSYRTILLLALVLFLGLALTQTKINQFTPDPILKWSAI